MGSNATTHTDQRAKAKKPKAPSQKEQSRRFIETAREIGADESGEAFDKAVGRVLPKPRDNQDR